uniref:uncharacterized protein LOC118543961 n=1 Tax=Halichoerus grypus TaxID=9711 RepID=UPI0016597507|nr:uncharacterized protein LOC118543961 [Halichoerus grypus]
MRLGSRPLRPRGRPGRLPPTTSQQRAPFDRAGPSSGPQPPLMRAGTLRPWLLSARIRRCSWLSAPLAGSVERRFQSGAETPVTFRSKSPSRPCVRGPSPRGLYGGRSWLGRDPRPPCLRLKRKCQSSGGSEGSGVDNTRHPGTPCPARTDGSVLLTSRQPWDREPWGTQQPVERCTMSSFADTQAHLGGHRACPPGGWNPHTDRGKCWRAHGGAGARTRTRKAARPLLRRLHVTSPYRPSNSTASSAPETNESVFRHLGMNVHSSQKWETRRRPSAGERAPGLCPPTPRASLGLSKG